ncbi:hypothetical protein [Phenylobacterium sp.]|uniref:hypothetical protein n=1 Tax=Phenylobacterium sp. TaxID=1871053 RepID=UPI0025CC3AE1|nr:hypothetical protein [Phenylobacterium sp.]MBX3486031.1 hypothetical protein [Phenylobacterium sp.]
MSPSDSARDDLAFLRAVVESGGDDAQRRLGEGYFAAGLCYGVQMLLHLGQYLNLVPSEGLVALVVAFGPTVVFTGLMIWLTKRRPSNADASMIGRALGAVFAAIGLANIALIAIIGSQALRLHNIEIWLIYPCVVLSLQGAAWMIVYALRRRAWTAVVSAGWFVTGVVMALSIGHPLAYVLTTGLGLFTLMVAPGVYMMRRPRES